MPSNWSPSNTATISRASLEDYVREFNEARVAPSEADNNVYVNLSLEQEETLTPEEPEFTTPTLNKKPKKYATPPMLYQIFDLGTGFLSQWGYPTGRETPPLLSLEIEVENVCHRLTFPKDSSGRYDLFSTTEDNSLRNNGIEIISNKPLTIGEAGPIIAEVFRVLEVEEATFSHRTSIHVHNNMLFKTELDIVAYVFLYSLVEDALYDFAGRNRKYSNFCVPILSRHLTRMNLPSIKDLPKYCGLSSFRMRDLGTIEWRHFPGTFNFPKLMLWLEMIHNLDLHCRHTTEDTYNAYRFLNVDVDAIVPILHNIFVYLDINPEKVARNLLLLRGMK